MLKYELDRMQDPIQVGLISVQCTKEVAYWLLGERIGSSYSCLLIEERNESCAHCTLQSCAYSIDISTGERIALVEDIGLERISHTLGVIGYPFK